MGQLEAILEAMDSIDDVSVPAEYLTNPLVSTQICTQTNTNNVYATFRVIFYAPSGDVPTLQLIADPSTLTPSAAIPPTPLGPTPPPL